MANDNNKIKNLVSVPDDEALPTLEQTATTQPGSGEVEDVQDSVASLQDDLRISERNTDRLLFDVEQFRARCSGLEKELAELKHQRAEAVPGRKPWWRRLFGKS